MSRFVGENEDLRDEWQEERMFEELEKQAKLAKAATLPAPPFECVRQCPCGARWDAEGWRKLRRVGVQVAPADGDAPELRLELRDCAMCGSTISIEVT